MKVTKFNEIIDRTEQLRTQLGMNKSRFSNRIGMKPQTYNNFLGAQSTKPNIELIYGIIQQYNVNPMWLLRGEGTMFREGGSPDLGGDAMSFRPFQSSPELRSSIDDSGQVLKQIEGRMQHTIPGGIPAIFHSIEILKKYFEIDPIYTINEVKKMLEGFTNRARE